MQLSKNFSLSEMTKSDTAIRKGIDNTPTESHKENMKLLVDKVLQPVRDHFAKSVRVTSGYRSEDLCEAIGSSKTSQHAKGQAADFEELAEWIIDNLDFDQIILEFYTDGDANSGWVHCSYKLHDNRKQVLRASRVDGKTHYTHGLTL